MPAFFTQKKYLDGGKSEVSQKLDFSLQVIFICIMHVLISVKTMNSNHLGLWKIMLKEYFIIEFSGGSTLAYTLICMAFGNLVRVEMRFKYVHCM